jgi:transketolase
MTAAHYRLITWWQLLTAMASITGSTEDVVQLEPLEEKFEAFGFAVRRCDGNDTLTCMDVRGCAIYAGELSLFWRKHAKEKELAYG